jgi:heme O synthase-like polyprenyltransferase
VYTWQSTRLLISGERDATRAQRTASDFAELVKARLTLLVLVTTAVGYYLGAPASVSGLGCSMLSRDGDGGAGAAALTNGGERQLDGLMHRTKGRGHSRRAHVGARRADRRALLSAGGSHYLAVAVSGSAPLAAVTIAIYILAYTP